jgi:hypothetical protein
LTALTRADLLLAGFWSPRLLVPVAWRRATLRPPGGRRAGGGGAGAGAMAPWVIAASARAGHFVPITQGSASALFVGTYLPGDGTTVGMKRALAPELKKQRPALAASGAMPSTPPTSSRLSRRAIPGLRADAAVTPGGAPQHRATTRRRTPVGFAGMMVNKVQRMWSRYARGGARHTSWEIRAWHICSCWPPSRAWWRAVALALACPGGDPAVAL